MNYYFLKDDEDYSIHAVIITEKSWKEIQDIIYKVRSKGEYTFSYYEDLMEEFNRRDICVIETVEIESVLY